MKDKMTINCKYGELIVNGNLFDRKYKIYKGNNEIADIKKDLFKLTDGYTIDINFEDEAFILTLIVIIDDILDKYYGESEHKLSSLFALARSKSPCVLFIDEVDALAGNRTEFRGNTGRSVINQLLSEMDGVENVNDGLLIIGATNTPWYIDPAFKRPGRFDKMIFVPPPDLEARDEIVQVILKGKPVQFVDVHKISEKTESYSGADLVQIVEQAIEKKFEASLSEGKVIPLNTNDILEEIKRYKPTTKDWFLTARNYANYANQTGFYDDVAQYIKKLKL